MPRFLAWGCNITGSLDPNVVGSFLTQPKDITETIKSDEIIWTGWSAAIGRTGGGIRVWGSSNILVNAKVKDFNISPVKRMLGFETIRGYLDGLGHAHDFQERRTTTRWDDMTISGLETVFAFSRADGLVVFPSVEHLFLDKEQLKVTHPAFSPIHPAKLYSMESRAFLHSLGPMQQLFEILTTDNKGKLCEPSLAPIEDLEGMEMVVIPGPCNRLGVVTDAGAAYVLEQRSREVELLEIDGDVRLLGLGSDFELIVVGNMVMTRGNNGYGQLGRTGHADWAEVEIEGEVTDVKCSRWGVILSTS